MKETGIDSEKSLYENDISASLDSSVEKCVKTNVSIKEALKTKLYSMGLGMEMENYSEKPKSYIEPMLAPRKNVTLNEDAKISLINLSSTSWDSSKKMNISRTVPKKKKKEVIRPISIEAQFLGTGEYTECFSVNVIHN
jgi:hypothetical protein